MIAVFVLLLMMGVAMMAYLYWWQQQQQKVVPTPSPPPRPSIAELHSECVNNPLNCQVDQTTIEEGDDPEYYEKEYGFKTNLQKMKQDLNEDEITALEGKTRQISQDALRDSMNHCKLRLPGDRLRRKTYDVRGKEIGREPTTMLGLRNEYINLAEPELDKMIADDTTTYAEYEQFLDAYGRKQGQGTYGVGGITDCDFYVDGCAVKESDVCHPDAIKKHKDILKNRPPIKEMPEEDYNRALEDSGLMIGAKGEVILTAQSQKIVDGASDEEKEKARKGFERASRIVQWMGLDGDDDLFLSSEEFRTAVGSQEVTHGMTKYMDLIDTNGDGLVNRNEFFDHKVNNWQSIDRNSNKNLDAKEWIQTVVDCSPYFGIKDIKGHLDQKLADGEISSEKHTNDSKACDTKYHSTPEGRKYLSSWLDTNWKPMMDLNKNGFVSNLEYGIFDAGYEVSNRGIYSSAQQK